MVALSKSPSDIRNELTDKVIRDLLGSAYRRGQPRLNLKPTGLSSTINRV
jgi:hypothetical protein